MLVLVCVFCHKSYFYFFFNLILAFNLIKFFKEQYVRRVFALYNLDRRPGKFRRDGNVFLGATACEEASLSPTRPVIRTVSKCFEHYLNVVSVVCVVTYFRHSSSSKRWLPSTLPSLDQVRHMSVLFSTLDIKFIDSFILVG